MNFIRYALAMNINLSRAGWRNRNHVLGTISAVLSSFAVAGAKHVVSLSTEGCS